MGEITAIEWCDATFNPWWGCTRVSPACDICYAEAFDKRVGGAHWGPHAERRVMSDAYWREPLKWDRKAREAGVKRRVFCASMADVFDNAAPDGQRDRLWALIRQTTNLRWLLLTKRPQNIAKMLPSDLQGDHRIWLGTTVENQEEADRRIPHLLAVSAAVRFLSCEPLLGPVDLARIPWRFNGFTGAPVRTVDALRGTIETHDPVFGAGGVAPGKIDWVIAGGESGPGSRPMHPVWAGDLRNQCVAAGVPVLFKQWGDWMPWLQFSDAARAADPSLEQSRFAAQVWDAEANAWAEHGGGYLDDPGADGPEGVDQIMGRVGKKLAGRLLDGRTWDQFPEAR